MDKHSNHHHRKRLGYARSILSVAAAASVGLSACAPDTESEAEVSANVTTDPRVQAVANDPEFVQLLHLLNEMSGQRLRYWHQVGELAPTQEVLADDADFIQAATSGQVDFTAYMQAVGIDPSNASNQHRLVERLMLRHDLSSPQLASQVLGQAVRTQSSMMIIRNGMEYELRDIEEPPPEETGCHDACRRTYAETVATAYAVYLGALGVSVSIGAGVVTAPVGIGAALFATAVFVRSLGRAQRQLDQCMARCDGDEPACQSDSDCDPDWFCQKNWPAENQCIPDRGEGGACTRDAACASGCCKWHPFGGHLFTGTCRPPNRCN